MMRTRALVVSTKTVAAIPALRRCTNGGVASLGMRGRVNPYSVFVDVRAVLDELRFAWGGRRRVCLDCNRCNQGYR
jgi:hypothetical protein